MYIIKLITLKDNKEYISSKVVECTDKKISAALILLDNVARNFVKKKFGENAYEQSKVLDIHKIDQICEPLVDGMLLYRLNDDPHRIHIYQKITEVIDQNGWFSTSKVPQSQFKKTHIFELEESSVIGLAEANVSSVIPKVEMVPIGPAGVKVPKPMTIAPMCNLINELRDCAKFKAQYASIDTHVKLLAASTKQTENKNEMTDNKNQADNKNTNMREVVS